MNEEVLSKIRNKGLLLDKDLYELVGHFQRSEDALVFLDKVEQFTGKKIITKNVFSENKELAERVVRILPGEDKEVVERFFVKLGISLEVGYEREVVSKTADSNERKKEGEDYRIFYADTTADKKLELKDFVGHFRSRYHAMQRILMEHTELHNNLVSINKISSDRSSVSIIGIVTEKRVTKNKNLIIRFEDLTGEIGGLIKFDKEDLFKLGSELQLDDVVGVKASGNSDLLFIHDIVFPESMKLDKTKFDEDVWVAFLSDVHCGSDRHLRKSFEQFLEWLDGDDEIAKKVKYVFFSGDNVDGVGIFPGQEEVLELKSMKEQYELLASYIRKIPKNITIFMCPGQHDATRVAEPQPPVSKKYAPELYEIENLVMVSNPTMVKLMEGEKEFKVLMYHGASIHSLINEIPELREMKAHKCPAKAVKHMLKRRHLAPTHSDVVYIPNYSKDPLVIEEVPDVLCTGEVHRLDIDNHNGVLIITGSCWQSQTDFEEKIGNIPDPGKVPLLSLKSRELKVYDFGLDEELRGEYVDK